MPFVLYPVFVVYPILVQVPIHDGGAEALAEVIKAQPGGSPWTRCHFHDKHLTERGGRALAEALVINTSLTDLSKGLLPVSQIKTDRITSLEYGIKERMDVCHTVILGALLRTNTSLTSVIIAGRGTAAAAANGETIGDDGAVHLARALQVNASLTILKLTMSSIGDVGAQAIADMIKVNTKLHTISLDGNVIGKVGESALRDALKYNRVLHNYEGPGGPLPDIEERHHTFVVAALQKIEPAVAALHVSDLAHSPYPSPTHESQLQRPAPFSSPAAGGAAVPAAAAAAVAAAGSGK